MSMYFRGRDYDSDNSVHPLDRKVMAILWGFARPYSRLLWWTVALMLLGTGADLARPYLLKVAIDSKIQIRDAAGLLTVAELYGATILASVVLAYLQTVLLQYIGQRIIFYVREKVYRHLIYQPYAQLEKVPVGRLVTRVTSDTDAIKDLYTDVIVAFANDLLVLTGIIVVMLMIDWRLALISFTVLPVMFVLAAAYQVFARKAYRAVREKTAAVNSFLQESMNGIGVLKAFARFGRTGAEYSAVNTEYLTAGLREMRTFALFRPLVDLVYTAAVVLVLWSGNWQNSYYGVGIGVIVAFLGYVEKFFWPIKDLAEKYSLLQSALAAAERVYDLLAEERPVEEPAASDSAEYNKFSGHIVFEDVWFAYEAEEWVLKGLNLEIGAGRFVGIVGLSGSGKTTLISLLIRLYDPQKGRILLDGTDIREIPLSVLRRQIGAVFQDVHLFNGTIAENIRLFQDGVADEEIHEAAAIAGIHSFIQSLPEGYATSVGYQGALLSAGQRQLLSLARALVLKADILIMDEATSSIDGETELLVQQALEKIARVHTMIVVAHRLSTIQQADEIVLIHRGRVAEKGSHEELLALRGFYYRLYSSQHYFAAEDAFGRKFENSHGIYQ